ncbi:MAG: phosphoribosylanthranilate isomerase [Spirochaetaceae bacterium]|jgi:phosphoribosylanthranilate isomerase|nr:phosphoribosylanthranilate isomerase [Spirochaetaceae bacterium]
MKIKICGLFREEDIDYVNEAEPDYAGFVFAESSRRVDFDTARQLSAGLKPEIVPVGVFVDAPADTIISLHSARVIRAAQLHGREDAAYVAKIKEAGITVIKTIQCASGGLKIESTSNSDFLLFDSGRGSGKRFDWSLLSDAGVAGKPWFLAGGINQDTIKEAVLLRPFGIDVSSGAESGGVKDREKIKKLVSCVRGI